MRSMATYEVQHVNRRGEDRTTVEAEEYHEEGSLTKFTDADDDVVFAMPTKDIISIRLVKK